MAKDYLSGKLAVILHADVAGSTALVQQDEQVAHERIQNAFQRFSDNIQKYQGKVLELRGDALLADFERASDAVTATLAFQADNAYHNSRIKDDIRPMVRVGIAMGEVIIADGTVTGAGVVLAQRVEQLADSGGLCITAALHESLPRRMPFDLEDLGDQVLKGFDDPVHVYRVELNPGESIPRPQQQGKRETAQQPWRLIIAIAIVVMVITVGATYLITSRMPRLEVASIDRVAFPLPDKPSIAVLPFTNISDDPKQEYFVDGMTEDLITDLSKLSGLFVIARNSVFAYKNKAVNIQQVAAELGVRYILEGSVRRAGEQIRINAQLIDATSGGHLWAERYDGDFKDVFALQDKITRRIVTALSVKLTPKEEERRVQKYTNNAQAYDAFLQGWNIGSFQGWNLGSFDSAEVFDLKVKYFEKAIELDPTYGHAHAALANLYTQIRDADGYSRRRFELLAVQHIKEALKYPTPLAHLVNARLLSEIDEWDEAVAEAGIAISLNPNDWIGYVAMCDLLIKMGRPAEAQIYLNEAIRLNPRDNYHLYHASIQFHLEKYDEAVETLLVGINSFKDDEWLYLLLGASYGHLGRKAEGGAAIQKFDELRKEKGINQPYRAIKLDYWIFKDEATRERIREGLLKAGMAPSYEY